MKKNIVLIGFMGTGKTTVGKILARSLGYKLIDIDQCVEEKERRKISEIFEKEGEAAFRKLEKSMIRWASGAASSVITTGGGAVIDPENRDMLAENGIIVALTATPETIYQRVKRSGHRPLLKTGDVLAEIKKLLEARRPFYEKADVSFVTDRQKPADTAKQIEEWLKAHGE
jgi:shikimate kinase